MKPLRFVAVASVVFFALAGNAWGMSKCAAGCRKQLELCMRKGTITRFACKEDCRLRYPDSAWQQIDCSGWCRQTFQATRSACKIDRRSCRDNCASAPDVDESCLESCGPQLISCIAGVLRTARSCVSACKTASDRLTCYNACLAAVDTDGAACGDAYDTCVGACGVLPPPFCGDGSCNGTEGSCSCPQDCGSVCGDGCCNGGETCSGCPGDCGPCS